MNQYNVYIILQANGKIYTDLTGRLPICSSKGNQYILVLYNYNSNAILAELMKNWSDEETLQTFKKLHQLLLNHGHKPKLHILDNKASSALQ